jgi:hypothetical protein
VFVELERGAAVLPGGGTMSIAPPKARDLATDRDRMVRESAAVKLAIQRDFGRCRSAGRKQCVSP